MYKFAIFLIISCFLVVNSVQGASNQDKVIQEAFDYCLAKTELPTMKTLTLKIFFSFVGENKTNRKTVSNTDFGKLPMNQQNAMNQEQFKDLVIAVSKSHNGGDVVEFLTTKMV
ncbi:uncharacterized protein LOC126847132 [Adelges cooleyi]|uniref:uncharacterized protein LOC126847132 n=1 Tax=Adelges cooleyi TaxID=133065 RepID=UPI0021803CB2|nr:uncharacterized protein LOC126847132 [Adelges cooleyi]